MTSSHTRKKIFYGITKSNWGGAQRYVFDLATGIAQEFDRAVVLGGNGELKERLEEAGIRVQVLSGLSRDVGLANDLRSFVQLLRLFKSEAPDIVHLNSSKMGALGALAARLVGVPTVLFTAHGWAFNEDRSVLSKAVIKLIYWFTFLLCTRVIVVSHALVRDVSRFPFVQKKFVVLHSGIVPVPLLSRAEARLKLMPNAPEHARWIGTIAELHHVKGLSYALRAMSEVTKRHDVVFVIVGEGEERERLQALIGELGLNDRAILVGHVQNAAAYLGAFDMFLLTSVSEALGYVLLEAGFASLPVVATNVGGIPEIVEHMHSGLLVPSRSVESIVSAVCALLEDPDRATQFGKALKEHVDASFRREPMLMLTMKLYK
ncbi:MAG: Second mannosyl transferase [Candidatus Giovannonibacteria bacterium GW2011_GWA2_53_7]|uniref:Second mannosyl transferase n=1 Tax=Candidatus Giovannonibacteria bacterium GW2011_GWA2_53_7 TaxID=1618650 RepID=A0A0G1Y162_9BACT|nr:MAG: Second mannosyl transferase [Candidatus Giovannonibacteria bacterium GW2011_GWA2_53_7]